LGDEIKEDEMDGNIARMESERYTRNFSRKSEMKRTLWSLDRRRENNIKMYLKINRM
jgi:hypothetical protein